MSFSLYVWWWWMFCSVVFTDPRSASENFLAPTTTKKVMLTLNHSGPYPRFRMKGGVSRRNKHSLYQVKWCKRLWCDKSVVWTVRGVKTVARGLGIKWMAEIVRNVDALICIFEAHVLSEWIAEGVLSAYLENSFEFEFEFDSWIDRAYFFVVFYYSQEKVLIKGNKPAKSDSRI